MNECIVELAKDIFFKFAFVSIVIMVMWGNVIDTT